MIWSHCGSQGVPPSSTFLMSIGVGGAGLMACACEGVPIPRHNARLRIDHHVFRTALPTFSLPQESIHCLATVARNLSRRFWPQRSCEDRRDLSRLHLPACPVVARFGRARPVISASIALNSRGLAGFRRRLSRGVWLLPSLCCSPSRFGRWFNDRWQFQLGLFCSAMMAVVQRLDACGFFLHPQLSVAIFLALVF